MFYLGYLLIDLEIGFPKLAPLGRALFTVGCVIAFLNACFLGETGLSSRIGLFIEAAAAAALILAIQAGGGNLGGILDHSWAHFAGRVSYSVFLVHTLIEDILIGVMWLSPLRIMTEHGLTYVFLWLGLLLSVPFVLLAAEGLYRWVEAPFIKMGKTLGSARPEVRGNLLSSP
jgi:peptidoglycan/LPS O-acetylase OafA/YrhL